MIVTRSDHCERSSSDVKKPKTESAKETVIFQKAINATAANLYAQMCEVRNPENKNFVFFTPNILASISMLYAIAPNDLKRVMEHEMNMGECSEGKWHEQFDEWTNNIQHRALKKTDEVALKLQLTQIVATHNEVSIMPGVKGDLDLYHPELMSFSSKKEVENLVNARIAELTEGAIKDLVSDLPSGLVLLMASAALFKGQWKYPFNTEKNSSENFYNSDGTKVKVRMMNQGIDNLRRACDYNKDEKYSVQIMELPFNGDVSLWLVKPGFSSWRHPKDSPEFKDMMMDCVEQVRKFMTHANIQKLLDHSGKRFRKVSALSLGIPKVALKDKTDLLSELAHTALSQSILDADFKGAFEGMTKTCKTPKLVSEVHFTMDEEGVAVAAASYSPTYRESCDPDFKLNCPFGIVMIDDATKTILSMGQVSKMEAVS